MSKIIQDSCPEPRCELAKGHEGAHLLSFRSFPNGAKAEGEIRWTTNSQAQAQSA